MEIPNIPGLFVVECFETDDDDTVSEGFVIRNILTGAILASGTIAQDSDGKDDFDYSSLFEETVDAPTEKSADNGR